MNKTIDYYNDNAQYFAGETLSVDFTQVQNIFSDLLPEKAYILDFGCGSGRDTKYFLELDYQVDALDGSLEMCKIAGKYTGINVNT